MNKENTMYFTSLGKITLCLAILFLWTGCSLQNSLSPKHSASRVTNQKELISNNSVAASADYMLISGDALGVSIFTNRKEVLAQQQGDANPEIQLAITKPNLLR
jgi:hypothetical protein